MHKYLKKIILKGKIILYLKLINKSAKLVFYALVNLNCFAKRIAFFTDAFVHQQMRLFVNQI